ncbi:conserved hypothetical protein [Trichinella spiralis]|uniref:hypothetical protein n=1 Tax=Trichinella spiralis TaxID=6334 RepID=UPI0001EFCB17|nr:conserved hypothetical protein [Trichinella spiralis]
MAWPACRIITPPQPCNNARQPGRFGEQKMLSFQVGTCGTQDPVGKPKNGFDHDQLGVIRPLVGHGNSALRQLWKADTCYSLVLVVHLQCEIASGVATEGPWPDGD